MGTKDEVLAKRFEASDQVALRVIEGVNDRRPNTRTFRTNDLEERDH